MSVLQQSDPEFEAFAEAGKIRVKIMLTARDLIRFYDELQTKSPGAIPEGAGWVSSIQKRKLNATGGEWSDLASARAIYHDLYTNLQAIQQELADLEQKQNERKNHGNQRVKNRRRNTAQHTR